MTPLSDAARTAARRAGRGAAALALRGVGVDRDRGAGARARGGALVPRLAALPRPGRAGLRREDRPRVGPPRDRWNAVARRGRARRGGARPARAARALRGAAARRRRAARGSGRPRRAHGAARPRAVDGDGSSPGRELVRARARLALARSPGRLGGRAGSLGRRSARGNAKPCSSRRDSSCCSSRSAASSRATTRGSLARRSRSATATRWRRRWPAPSACTCCIA